MSIYKIRFLGYSIQESQISLIDRVIQFANKSPDEILKKTQLQRFLGSLNCVAEFHQNQRKRCKIFFDRLQDNPTPWTSAHTSIVKEIKQYVKTLPCLCNLTVNSFKIVETDASYIGHSGILKQKTTFDQLEQIVRFHSSVWNQAQINYSTIKKKEILSTVLCISKFQDDILNQKILGRVDCKNAKNVLEKDVSKHCIKTNFCTMTSYFEHFLF